MGPALLDVAGSIPPPAWLACRLKTRGFARGQYTPEGDFPAHFRWWRNCLKIQEWARPVTPWDSPSARALSAFLANIRQDMEASLGVQRRKSVVCCWGHVGLRTPFGLPDRPLTHQGYLMTLCDPIILGTARKSLASCLDIEVLTLT